MGGSSVRLVSILIAACVLGPVGSARAATDGPPAAGQDAAPDGSRDFDFELGEWTTRLRRLERPLSGSTAWIEYEGTTVVKPVLGGRANVAELSVEGPAGRIEGLSLRLYEPGTRQWTLNFANITDGQLTPPVRGGFRAGRGEFHANDTFNGRPVMVRFVISDITPDSARFEQAFSIDGGATWEINWIAEDRRR